MFRQRFPATIEVHPDPASDVLSHAVEAAVGVLDGSGAVIVPTDTVYGVAARIDRPAAVAALFDLKGRDRSKPLAVLVADADQAMTSIASQELDARTSELLVALVERCWPGALTLVLPRAETLRDVDLGGAAATIGIRCPRSPIVRGIAGRVGPLVTTSANPSGESTPATASAAARSLTDSVGLVIDAGPCTEAPSTVLDLTVRPFRVLRSGPVDVTALGIDLDA